MASIYPKFPGQPSKLRTFLVEIVVHTIFIHFTANKRALFFVNVNRDPDGSPIFREIIRASNPVRARLHAVAAFWEKFYLQGVKFESPAEGLKLAFEIMARYRHNHYLPRSLELNIEEIYSGDRRESWNEICNQEPFFRRVTRKETAAMLFQRWQP
ncbi:MAG: hypothetical protein ABI747_01540 [Candidatus Moraniibacteriota bacterium]